MERSLQRGTDSAILYQDILQVPIALHKAAAAADSSGAPGRGLLKVADEHFKQAHGIGPVFLDDVIRVYHISSGFAHFLAVFSQDHAMAGALGIGLRRGNNLDIVKELMPEAAVKQVQCGMLHSAVIPVHRRPVLQRLLRRQGLIVAGIGIPQKIPGRAGPLRHGIGFPLGGAAAVRTGGIHPIGHIG